MARLVSPADVRVVGLTALLLLTLYTLTMAGRLTSGDGETVYQTTRALVTRARLAVAPRPETAAGRNGAHYGKYGLGQSIVQAPFFVVGHVTGRLFAARDDRPARFAVGLANAFVSATLAAVFWLVVRALGAGPHAATGGTLVLGLSTLVWPYARSDFSEPLQALSLLLVFLLALWWRRQPSHRLAAGVGLAAAGAFLTKAASLIVLPPLGAFVLFCVWRRQRDRPMAALLSVAWAALPIVAAVGLQAALNMYRFGSVSEFGYGSEPAVGFTTPLVSGASYLLFSSGKGLLWFSAPAVLGAVLLPLLLRRRPVEMLVVLGVFAFELAYFGRWWAWHGDWSWGPRYLYLTVPFLLIPVPLLLHRSSVRIATIAVAVVGSAAALLGVLIDYGGYYSVVSSQIGRGVDVQEARLVPPFSPLLGHAWLARASLHEAVASWSDPDHDPRDNPQWGQHPWAASHPALSPEAPERAVGFDLWFVALRDRTRIAEYWSWLAAAWFVTFTARIAVALLRALRSPRVWPSVQGQPPGVLTRDIREPMEPVWQRG